MKLISFRYRDSDRFGIVTEQGVMDLFKRLEGKYADLRSLLSAGGLDLPEMKSLISTGTADYQISDIEWLPVIPNPDKIVCVGVNYDEHRIEANIAKSKHPTIFLRLTQSQVAHNKAIIVPIESRQLDYEGEVAVIIGRGGRRIPEDQAVDYIAGYTCYNDASVRDWQTHTTQWSPGKNFDHTGGLGPWMVTRDEIPDNEPLTLETRLNGQVVQHATTDMLVFSIPRLISYISTFTTLVPGDVIATGTPSGVGAKRNPPLFMKDGDIVEVEISRIGTLVNPVKSEGIGNV